MKISELINDLQAKLEKAGDLNVVLFIADASGDELETFVSDDIFVKHPANVNGLVDYVAICVDDYRGCGAIG